MATYIRYPSTSLTASPIEINVDGVATTVNLDTIVPASSIPVPVQIINGAAAGTVDQGLPNTIANAWPVLPTDGTNSQAFTAGSEAQVSDATSHTSLASIDGKLNSLGQKLMAASAPVVIASDQSAIPASQSGTWNINDISGTISLPTGAATEATLATLDGKVTACNTGAVTISAALPAGGNTIGAVTQSSGPWSQNITQIGGVALALGQTTMSASIPVVLSSNQSTLPVTPAASTGRAKVNILRNAYASVNVTTAAYVQLVASTAAIINLLDIFDSSGQTLVFAVGGAGAEVDQFNIYPGGNGRIELAIPASSRLSVKAVSATASTGELDINCFS